MLLHSSTLHSQMILICFSNSSCQGRTVRTAPSIAFPATGAPTQTRLCTRPWHPLSARAALPRPPRSPCQGSRPRTRQLTGPSRENQTPLRSGLSPGACMKVGVSIYIFGGGWMRAACGVGSVETLGVCKWYCRFWFTPEDVSRNSGFWVRDMLSV